MRRTGAAAAADGMASYGAIRSPVPRSTGMISQAERLSLLRRLTRLTRNADAAEDCLQSAFVRLEEYRLHTSIDNVVGFLAHAARNIAIDEARKSRVRAGCGNVVALHNYRDDRPLQDEVLVARERLSQARAALIELPERTRTAFLMHRFTSAKYRDIAVELGISISAVEKHIARASLALANSGKRYGADAPCAVRAAPIGAERKWSVGCEVIGRQNVIAAVGCGDAVRSSGAPIQNDAP